jgi:hypothetical protein
VRALAKKATAVVLDVIAIALAALLKEYANLFSIVFIAFLSISALY